MTVKATSVVGSRIVGALLVIASVAGTPIVGVGQQKSPSDVAFERLKGLVGRWDATEKGKPRKMTATYRLTGRGSVLVEELGSPGSSVVGMSTAYHLDHGTLVLTHFCGAGNQPRMRVKTIENDGRHIVFEMYDITNLATSESFHSNAVEIIFRSDDRVDLIYRGTRGAAPGTKSEQVFQLKRRRVVLNSECCTIVSRRAR